MTSNTNRDETIPSDIIQVFIFLTALFAVGCVGIYKLLRICLFSGSGSIVHILKSLKAGFTALRG